MRSLRLVLAAFVVLAAPLAAQGTATVCKDATNSVATGRGACSGHGGVDAKATAAAAKAARKAAKVAANSVHKKTEKHEAKAEKAEEKTENARMKEGSGKGGDKNPVGAIAKCKDGTYSHAASRRGACSRHGGVASWT